MWWTVLVWAYRVKTKKKMIVCIFKVLKEKIFSYKDYLAKLSIRIEEEIRVFQMTKS